MPAAAKKAAPAPQEKMSKEKKETDPMPLIEAFLLKHKGDFELTASHAKVHCKVTGHDLPLRVAGLEEHAKTKKFLASKKKGRVQLDFDWDQYAPHIISHKKDKKGLFCQLTASRLNKNPTEIEKHMAGKRFKAAVRDFEEMVAKDLAGELSDLEGDEEEEEEDSMDALLATDDEEEAEEDVDEAPPAKKQKTEDKPVAGGEAKATPTKKKAGAAKAKETELKQKKKKKGKKQKVNSKKRRAQKSGKKN